MPYCYKTNDNKLIPTTLTWVCELRDIDVIAKKYFRLYFSLPKCGQHKYNYGQKQIQVYYKNIIFKCTSFK